MINLLVSILSFVLLALLSGNNLAICTGSIISGRMVSRKTGIVIAISGYIIGLVLQGGLLGPSVNMILPLSSPSIISLALIISIVVFLIGYKLRVPQSLSITLTMALIGISLAFHTAINKEFVALMLFFWIAATLAAVLASLFVLRRAARRMRKRHIWPMLRKIRVALIAVSFLGSIAFGANTVGLLYSSVSAYTSIWVLVAAVIVGGFMLSSGPLKRLGEQVLPIRYLNALVLQSVSTVLVEAATLVGIPFSNSQAYIASLYGAGLSYKTKLLLKRNMLTIIFSWIVTAAISLVLGYLLTLFL